MRGEYEATQTVFTWRLGLSGPRTRSGGRRLVTLGAGRGQFAVGDLEVLEASVIQPGHVAHQLGAHDGQGQGARGGDHREAAQA